MTAHPARLHRRSDGPRSLPAPLEDTPRGRGAAAWIDRHDHSDGSYTASTTNTADHIPGTIPVLTYRAYFDEYRAHPEHKALGHDGTHCHPWTRGILRPSVVTAT